MWARRSLKKGSRMRFDNVLKPLGSDVGWNHCDAPSGRGCHPSRTSFLEQYGQQLRRPKLWLSRTTRTGGKFSNVTTNARRLYSAQRSQPGIFYSVAVSAQVLQDVTANRRTYRKERRETRFSVWSRKV